MGKRSRLREREIEDAVRRAGRTSVTRAGVVGQGVDLSPAAAAARARASERTGRDGGYTGRELIEQADLKLARANRLAKVAQRTTGHRKRRAKADRDSDELLLAAAVSIRLAELCPLSRPYLHALALPQIQTVKGEVTAAFQADPGALAVDTHRRINDQRTRVRNELST